MDISVVIPLYNEEESLPELYAWIERVMKENNFSYEVIFINDGSTDGSWKVISRLSEEHECVKGIKFRRNYGKSPALFCGFKEAQGDVVITMDADLQDSPDEIPELYRMITEDGYDLVSGYKQKRYDPLSKTIPTKLFNATARKISGIKNLHDFNCGLKAYRKDVVKNIEVYGEMHRYIPYLAKNAGFDRIGEKSGSSPVAQVRQVEIRPQPLLQRLSRPYNIVVPEQLRTQADARVRLPRHNNVLHRLHCSSHYRHRQAGGSVKRSADAPRNRYALLLYIADNDDYRHTTVSCRIPRRPHQPQFFRQERLSDI